MNKFNNKMLSMNNRKRCLESFNKDLNDWEVDDAYLAACGKFGEIGNYFSSLRNQNKDNPNIDELKKNIGQTIIYLDLLAQRNGLDTWECVQNTFDDKSEKLGYKWKIHDS